MKALAGAALAMALVVGAAACASDGSDTGTDEAGAEGRGDSATTLSSIPGADLAGRWAHYDIVAYEDDTLKTMIVSYGFTDFAVKDGELIESEEFCTAEQVTDQAIETSVSDAATQAIRPEPTPVEVSGEPGAWEVHRPATPTPVGIRLDDPVDESLPDDPDDPRIVDDDGDGKPGITVEIRIGDSVEELYIARREIFAYDLVQDGPDSMTGTVTDGSEQLVIGATDPIFEGSGGAWVQVPDLSFSPILLERVDEDWDCDRLVAERDDLFPPNPPIEW
ncbi:MAG: hypothetical protein JNK12_14650 [Acidimicrobiales bacterium]|nr:hypothetical protein [Acidimicrobiales bacterium]